jgi:hypothetical protein
MPLTLKINNKLADWQDFIQEKIEFIHPLGNSIDMEYNYFDGYAKIPCEVDFNSDEFDLILEFGEIGEKEEKMVLEDLEGWDLEVILEKTKL